MNKKFFASLLLGFGASLGVLVAVAMPPGSWGVVIGVALGLLASIPLFVVLIMLLNRDRTRPREQYQEREPQQVPIIVVQQPGLPYGNRYVQPGYELYSQPEAYNYLEVPEGYEYYPQPQNYLAQPQPRPAEPPRRKKVNHQRLQAGYYAEPQPNPGYDQPYYPTQGQPAEYYGRNQPIAETDLYGYYYEPEAGQAQPNYYYEEQMPPRRRVVRPEVEIEAEDYVGYPPEQYRPVNRVRRSNIQSNQANDEVVDAKFRTLGE